MAVGNRVEAGRQRQSGRLELSPIQTIRRCVKTWSGLSESWGVKIWWKRELGGHRSWESMAKTSWREQKGRPAAAADTIAGERPLTRRVKVRSWVRKKCRGFIDS
ncbi:unnamed protein product [Linum trigynum]|uniref:Uncharacterized protein n=1 Tax=Linum trigynum TaxID=586398 RepID=A0AAV2F925_9ROSI